MMKVKVQFGNDIRKWRYPDSKRYQNLLIFIKQTFGFVDDNQFYVQFEDDEGDRLTLTSETDFVDAFSSAEQEGRKSLKIFVVKGSIEDSHNNNNDVLHSFSISSPASTSSRVQSIEEKQQPQQVKPKINEQVQNAKKPEVEVEVDNEKEEKLEEPSQQNNTCHGWRQMALDFLQNKEIQTLLPQLVRRFVTQLRKEQQQPISNQKSLLAIVHEVLGEDQFKPIVKHTLYSEKIVFLLPHIVEKLQLYQGLLLTFNEDAIVSWVPQLINTLINSVSHFENINVEIDVDPMYNQFFPFSCMQQQQQNSNANTNGNVHSQVTCDNCQCHPITGPRYKCSVCSNYDLCSKCEALNKHDITHPLLKITSSVNCANQDYVGLHEFLKWSSRRGRHCPRGYNYWSRRCRRFDSFQECRNNEQTINDCENSCPREKKLNANKVSAKFIEDVNIPDRSFCPVDTVMTKIWKVHNDGDVEWGNDVELVFLKGNECLVLEKRYAVPNAQPGEKVDVSAVIKTPFKSGRYCTYFKLQKNGVFFGPTLWVELFAVAENNQSIKTNVICVCGEKLVSVNPRETYNNCQVFCDVCNRKCLSDSTIYHCPQNRNSSHPEGYDMCIDCVNFQNASILESNIGNTSNQDLHKKVYVDIQLDVPQVQQNENNNNIVNNNDKKSDDENIVNDKKVEENQIKIEDFDPIPLDSVIVNGNENNNQIDNMSLSNHSEPEIIEMKDLNDNDNDNQNDVHVIANNDQIQQNQEDNFEFKKELDLLLEMGFYDSEAIKKLLVQYKGEIQKVVEQLLQA